MLVLSRQRGEVIVITPANIRVTVCDIRGDKVRLGFEAPKGQEIMRAELIQEQR